MSDLPASVPAASLSVPAVAVLRRLLERWLEHGGPIASAHFGAVTITTREVARLGDVETAAEVWAILREIDDVTLEVPVVDEDGRDAGSLTGGLLGSLRLRSSEHTDAGVVRVYLGSVATSRTAADGDTAWLDDEALTVSVAALGGTDR